MGESLSALPLIEAFLVRHPDWRALITTVTVTSAKAMAEKLPARAFHQFAPLDHPGALRRFLTHWQPRSCLWVESELWPNMLHMAKESGCEMFLVNARMSNRSFRRWRLVGSLIRPMLQCFTAVFAQSQTDAERFRTLGTERVETLGNLKYDTPPLPHNEAELARLREAVGSRPLWLAASTHEGEEILIAETHRQLEKDFPSLLTVIVPRHANRGAALAGKLRGQGFTLSQRSQHDPLTPGTQIYLADTMGELGLFYRLCPIAFLGGSLIPHGGQNLLEAARLGCALLTGPHTQNFTAICADLERANALTRVASVDALQHALSHFLKNPDAARKAGAQAQTALNDHQGVIIRLLDRIEEQLA
jgi:3-deoxy-D-manno-octulosonic-acid transferase